MAWSAVRTLQLFLARGAIAEKLTSGEENATTDIVTTREVNFDGLVGPTHNYAGLAPGNLLSNASALSVAHPRAAALQGLSKMRHLYRLGCTQAVLPPQPRPDISALRGLGFSGTPETILRTAAREAPALLSACTSASAMWAANAATVTPSIDSGDGRLKITPANLSTLFHRAIEAPQTTHIFKQIFSNDALFDVQSPLAGGTAMADEGAANHTRFAQAAGRRGIGFFVYGRRGVQGTDSADAQHARQRRFQGRQTLEASQAIARRHGLREGQVVFAEQSAEAIDAGVFHNDVIAVGNGHVLLYHEDAFVETDHVLGALRGALSACSNDGTERAFLPLCVQREELSLQDAVESYLFNSQLLSMPADPELMMILAPEEARNNQRALRVLERIQREDNPIEHIEFIDVRQSMRNGGGPACLRLRVMLNDQELDAMHQGVLLTDALADELEGWINAHYRESLSPEDLADPTLLSESEQALAALGELLGLSLSYPCSQPSQ